MDAANCTVLYIACVIAAGSAVLFGLDKKSIAIMLLCISAGLLRWHMVHLDPFLHDWDEKFHALVARNMMDDPFTPVLKKGIFTNYDYKAWCCNNIWLHKQPLFMWQMALSMKLFGVSEYTIRYPDILMGMLMVLMVYRIGRQVADEATGFIAAMLMCFSNYQLELTSGYYGMDHNDLTFGFYVLASVWAYTEYIRKPSWQWIMCIGLFAGCAVLNKWLSGLLVFACWALHMILYRKQGLVKQESGHFVAAVLIALVVFLPWQIYILHAFPLEARYELGYNSRHLLEVVEGHNGSIWYYWNHFKLYFGKYIWVLMPVGLLMIHVMQKYKGRYATTITSAVWIVFIFFSFIVRSKLQSYFFVVAPLGYICMAAVIVQLASLTKRQYLWQLAGAVVASVVLLHYREINRLHHPDNRERQVKIHNTRIFKRVKHTLPEDVTVVTNVGDWADVEFMFYNPGIVAYSYQPTEAEADMMIEKGIRMASFSNRLYHVSPQYIWFYPHNYIIQENLK